MTESDPIRLAIQYASNNEIFPKGLIRKVMNQIMDGAATPAQVGALLMASKLNGDDPQTIIEAASVMRERALKVNVGSEYVVDTCGTGGDGLGLFNVSTASAFIAAAAGCKVAKHGNRSVSSTTGSADVLETAGINLNLPVEKIENCINECGLGFLFAPAHHSATKYAVGPRKELGIRTFFNLLGPLTNPANAPNQIMGIFSKDWVYKTATVLKELGSRHVMVVHSDDGMDEISLSAPTNVAELKNGEITEYIISPENFGIKSQNCESLTVDNAEQSLQMIEHAFQHGTGMAADILALNAGAAIYVSGREKTLKDGVKAAQEILLSGKALAKFNQFKEISNG